MSEEFDDIMRQKFAEKEFIFNEANWEKAEIRIDAALKLKKLMLWGSLFSVGLITGICCMFLWKKDKHVEKTKNNPTELTQTINEDQKTSVTSSDTYNAEPDFSNSSSDQTSTTHTEEQLNQNSILSEENTYSSTSAQKTNLTSTANVTPTANNSTGKKGKTLPANKKTANHSTDLTSVSGGKEIDFAEKKQASKKGKQSFTSAKDEKNKNTALTQNTTSTQRTTAVKNSKKKTKQPAASSGDKEENEKTDASLTALENNITEKKAAKKKISTTSDKKEKASTKEVTPAKNGVATLKDASVAKNNLTADSTKSDMLNDSALALKNELKNPVAVASDSLNDSLKSVAIADSLEKKKDSIPALDKAADAAASLGMDGLASTNLFHIDAGANAQLGWKYLNTKEAQGITPVVGVSALHYFNQKWSVNAGVHYSSIAYLKTNTFNAVVNYSFGVTNQTSTFKPYTLHYVGVPVYINYHVNEKNAIFAGANFSYLINNKIRVQREQSNTLTNYIQPTNDPTEILSGFYNRMDLSVAAGYRRKLISHFSIAPVFYFGLFDIKKDARFGLNQFERNSGVKLILSYTIFDF